MDKFIDFLNNKLNPGGVTIGGIVYICLSLCLSGCHNEKPATSVETKKSNQKVDLDHFLLPDKVTNLEDAIKLYVKPGKKSVGDLIEAARLAMKQDDYKASEELMNLAIQKEPDGNPEVYSIRGRSIYNSFDNRNKEALPDLLKAVELGSVDSHDYVAISSIYDDWKQPKKAIEYLTRGMERTRNRDMYLTRACLYASIGEDKKALADYDTCLEINPDYARGNILRGQLHEKVGNYKQALEDYRTAATKHKKGKLSTASVVARKLEILLLDKIGKHDQAVKVLNEALIDNKEDKAELLQLRGDQYSKLKRYEEALNDYSQSIRGEPKFARLSYLGRARVYELLGKKALAKEDREKARVIKLAPAEKAVY